MERIELKDVAKNYYGHGAINPDAAKLADIFNKIIQEIECLKGGNEIKGETIYDKTPLFPRTPKEPTTGGWEDRFDEAFCRDYIPNGEMKYVELRGSEVATLKAFIAREKEASYKEGVKETMLGVAKLIDGFDKLTNK